MLGGKETWMSKRMSRENQKLIYWFIDCYAYKLKGVDINWQTSKQKPAISDYFLYKAKEDLKKLYIKHSGINLKGYKPFKNIEEKLRIRLNEVLDKNYTKETKINIVTNDLIDFVREEMQRFLLTLTGAFSLKLDMMSNNGAIAFTNYLFDYFLQNDIAMWEEMQMLYKQQNEEKYIYSMLKHRKCAVCGKYHTESNSIDLEHWDSIASTHGTYKKDTGQEGRYISLCRLHHNQKHNWGVQTFERKYNVRGIYLDDEQIKELKKIYKGHFKGFKEEK